MKSTAILIFEGRLIYGPELGFRHLFPKTFDVGQVRIGRLIAETSKNA